MLDYDSITDNLIYEEKSESKKIIEITQEIDKNIEDLLVEKIRRIVIKGQIDGK